MNKNYILALDQGTTSSRAVLFDRKGEIKASSQLEFKQIYPQPSWVEHDAMEILRSQIKVSLEVIQNNKIDVTEIAALGITNQRETTVVWDKDSGYPIYNAIVWQDRRTSEFCDSIKEKYSELIKKKTGLVIDAYFSGTKLKWILDNIAEAREKAIQGKLLFGTIDTWLIWNLTRRRSFVTDYSNASRTMLFNIHTGEWDNELLELFDIPKNMLPEIVSSSEVVGQASSGIFGKRIPITGIAGDQHAATFGNGCLKKGMIKNTYGTGCFMVQNTQTSVASKTKLLTIPLWKKQAKVVYGLEGSIFIGGAVVQWLRDELEFFKESHEIEELALKTADNGGVYIVPAFVGLGAPNWDQYARGTIIGITRGVNRSHIARACLESIAYQSYDLIHAMQSETNSEIHTLRVDGGATQNNLLMQFQADILGIVVERPKILETTALGVAFLAGLAVDFWSSDDEIEKIWQLDTRFEPHMNNNLREKYLHNWHKALERAKNWIE